MGPPFGPALLAVACFAALSVPSARTGGATRSGYGFVRAAQAAGLLDGPWAHVLRWSLLAVPVLAGLSGAAAVLRAGKASAVSCGLAGLATLAFFGLVVRQIAKQRPAWPVGGGGARGRGRGYRLSLRHTRECLSCPMKPVGTRGHKCRLRLPQVLSLRKGHRLLSGPSLRGTGKDREQKSRRHHPASGPPPAGRVFLTIAAVVAWWGRGREHRWPCPALRPRGRARRLGQPATCSMLWATAMSRHARRPGAG